MAIGLEKIERLIELCLISGYVKDGNAPLSAILVSHPECNKTNTLLKFSFPHSIETTDLSAKPISEFIIPKLRNNELNHIIIPDMIKMLSHRQSTVDSTIAFLNALMEEGLKQNLFFGQVFEFKERKKCGLLTAVTFDFYYKVFRKWREIGFSSRFLPISYTYSKSTVSQIHDAIQNSTSLDELSKGKKVTKKKIQIKENEASWINVKANEIAKEQSNESIRVTVRGGNQKRIKIEVYGFRLHKQLRKLAMSIALSHKELIVTWSHIKELDLLLDYIRMPKNPKVV